MLTSNSTKLIGAFCALFLLAACGSRSDEAGPVAGTGPVAGGNTGTTMPDTQTGGMQYAPGSREEFAYAVGDRVFFDTDRYDLSSEAQQQLSRQAQWLMAYPATTVTIEGHADERGTREYNLALGDRRANAARNYLVALGVGPERINVISYGKERPEALGSDETAWAQNRRAVTVLN